MNFIKNIFICLLLVSKLSNVYCQSIESLEKKLQTTLINDKLPLLNQLNILYIEKGDKVSEAYNLINIGDVYLNQSKTSNAILYYTKALKIFETHKNNKAIIVALNKIGLVYSKFGDFDQALINFTSALTIADKNNMDKELIIISKNIEAINKNQKNIKKTETAYSQKKEKETINTINSLVDQNEQSLKEISKLSLEAQLQELIIKAQEAEITRKKLEADNQKKITENQIKINTLLQNEKEFEKIVAQEKLNKQKFIIVGVSVVALLLTIMSLLILRSYKLKKKANILLEEKNIAINIQKNEIEKKNNIIIDSIEYAQNIQKVILPSEEEMNKQFQEYFILYKPKDIVSGDFYWIHESNDRALIAVADCTGHGVSGAFVSLMGYNLLNNSINDNPQSSPSEILTVLNDKILNTLKQNSKNVSAKYGMDIALISISKMKSNTLPDTSIGLLVDNTLTGEEYELQYAGAHNPLLIFRGTEYFQLKATSRSIGSYKKDAEKGFTNNIFKLRKGDMLYMFSDGYVDQFGGPENKKIFAQPFREILQSICQLSMEEQRSILDETLNQWKGNLTQTDDVLVLGIRIS